MKQSVRVSRAGGLAALLMLAPCTMTSPAAADGDALRPLSALPRERIAIETRGARRHLFEAWRADTPETRAQGLMFVHRIEPTQAMIFVYEPPQVVGMWMKNTLIPLDMLFVDERGCVVKVHQRAQPGSLATITTDALVVLVVELAGGTAEALALRTGDRVVRPDAGWPRQPAPCIPSS